MINIIYEYQLLYITLLYCFIPDHDHFLEIKMQFGITQTIRLPRQNLDWVTKILNTSQTSEYELFKQNLSLIHNGLNLCSGWLKEKICLGGHGLCSQTVIVSIFYDRNSQMLYRKNSTTLHLKFSPQKERKNHFSYTHLMFSQLLTCNLQLYLFIL